MKKTAQLVVFMMGSLVTFASVQAANTVAGSVVSYVQGTVATGDASFNDPNAALGSINGIEPDWQGNGAGVNPFNPPYVNSDIVVVGQGGNLTLHLSRSVATNGRNLGVYVNNGYWDYSADGSGLTDGGPATFSAPPQAVVSVSQDGITWSQLNGGAPITFGVATNYYTDSNISNYDQLPGTQTAHQSKPFLGSAADLANKTYAQIKTAFNNSCGGNWLDLSGTGLVAVNYVRFSVPADGTRMVVDAIGGLGAAAPLVHGGRIISESVGTGASTSHVVVDFGPQSYEFDVHYDGNMTGLQALQLLAADSDFALTTKPFGATGLFVTGLDYGGYAQTGDGSGGTNYWSYYTGDGNTWAYSGLGAGLRNLTDGSFDGWIWASGVTAGPDFPVAAPEPASLGLLALGTCALVARRRARKG